MDGYAKVANLMSTYDEFAILRGFKALNLQNLLYLQAEIINLEHDLNKLVHIDAAHPDREFYSKDWWSLAHGECKEGQNQWRQICRIRKKLDQYNDSLQKQILLSRLKGPNPLDLKFLRQWFERPSMGAFPIRGLDMAAWDDGSDLIAIKPRNTPDPLSIWLTNAFFPFLHRVLGERFKTPESPELGEGLYVYKESLLAWTINTVATVAASVLPLVSIIVLFFLKSNAYKLCATVIFSAFFSLALCLMTNARRVEIFASTAAFAAVNVVFLTSSVPSTTI